MRIRRLCAAVIIGIGILAARDVRADVFELAKKVHVGPEVGAFFPSSGKASNRFGDTWFSAGVGFGGLRVPAVKGRISPDFGVLFHEHGSNHAFLLPVGMEYRRGLARSRRMMPYAGASANVVITDLRSDPDGVQSRFRTAYGGSVFVGVLYNRHAFFEARYYGITAVRSLDLSGVDVKAGYRF